LAWSGATGTTVDIYRNGSRLVTTTNDGNHSDNKLANGSWSYRVCLAGSTSVCSASASIVY
jgi:hypothetical protein